MIIRKLTDKDHVDLIEISESLSEWFDQSAGRKSIPVDIRHQCGYAAIIGSAVVGFITLYIAEGRLNIGWLGVHREFQGRLIGKALLQKAEDQARKLAIGEIELYTLNGVSLMTIYKAKGLEFLAVFVITGLMDGMLPHKNRDIEEERRICFVVISKAMRQLYVTHCHTYAGKPESGRRFLAEMFRGSAE